MSAYTVNSSRQKILDELIPCTILWVDGISQKKHSGLRTRENENTVVVTVRFSLKPFLISYHETLTSQQPLQVVHLTSMITFSRVWEMIRLGFPVRSRMDIIFDKKNDVSASVSIFPSIIS
jgi:hypothetical protein